MFMLCQKITQCRKALFDWSRVAFDNGVSRTNALVEMVEVLQQDNAQGQHNQCIRELRQEVNTLLLQDEIYWRQRSRESWLTAGDRNTKFFHQRAKQRKGRNLIKGIMDSNGIWWENEAHMGNVAIDYFNDIFSANPSMEMDDTIHVVDCVVNEDMNQQLLSPFTALEIRQAAFQMHPSKASGPD
ncbi:hypothetical protein FCV25MIE_13039, partial [Fagus crenata]